MHPVALSVILRYMNNTASQPTTAGFFAAQKFGATSTVHVAKAGRVGTVITFCTGRSIAWMVGTDAPVTCKACVKKAAANGMDLKELQS